MRIGINGLGRIGRSFFRLAWGSPQTQVTAINDVAPPRTLAHLLRNDSVTGKWDVEIRPREAELVVEGRSIPCWASHSPESIPWTEGGVDLVIEATGRFVRRSSAAGHLRGSVRHVIISSPSDDADFTVGWGVNQANIDPARHRILSGASCTTQCAAPLIRLVDGQWGMEACSITTVHCMTNDQPVMDAPHRDLRRSRAAGMSMIPTTTSASGALRKIFPALAGRIDCLAVRVPTPFVSALELVASLKRDADLEEARELFRRAAESGPMAGIVGYTDEELVSVDYRGESRSAVVDGSLLALASPRLLRLFAWYDNESGYTHRLLDLVGHLGRRGGAVR